MIPQAPGLFSALGMLMADLRRALTASIAADESYAAWGATLLREQPCNGSGSGDPHWAAAKAAELDRSEWMRLTLNAAAKRALKRRS